MKQKKNNVAPNLLLRRNLLADINIVWSVDDTKVPFLDSNNLLTVLFFIDIGSRKILDFIATKTDINSSHVTRTAMKLIRKHHTRLDKERNNYIILHSDQDTHFTSKKWFSLEEQFKGYVRLSMSEPGKPMENGVSERLNGTFKHMIVKDEKSILNNTSFMQFFSNIHSDQYSTKQLKNFLKEFVVYYNTTHKHRILDSQPETVHSSFSVARHFCDPPQIKAVRINGSSPVEDVQAVKLHRQDLFEKAIEIRDKYYQDDLNSHEKRLLNEVDRLVKIESKKLATLSQAQFSVLFDKLEEIQEDFEQSLNKKKMKSRKVQKVPLRDPILFETFLLILKTPAKFKQISEEISWAQFKIAMVLAYISGCRINEIATFTFEDFINVKNTKILTLLQTKQNEIRQVAVGDNGRSLLDLIEYEVIFLFKEQGFVFLSSTNRNKNERMSVSSWIRAFNKHLKRLKTEYNIDLCISSHSFRIAFVTRLLSKHDISIVNKIIGHKTLSTTQKYNRFMLKADKMRKLVDDSLVADLNGDIDTNRLSN
jgi:transposase InsO family protein/site-specific recombinase XerD